MYVDTNDYTNPVADPNSVGGNSIITDWFSGVGSILNGAADLFDNGRAIYDDIFGSKSAAEDAIRSDTTKSPKVAPAASTGFLTTYKTPIMLGLAVVAAFIIYKSVK